MLLAVTALAVSLVFGAASPTPTPALTQTGTPTITPTPTLALFGTPTLAPTSTPWPTATPTFTPTATAIPTATPVPTPKPPSSLPATQPGIGRDEGTFLVTAADDGSRANYFIAGNTRHSILTADLQLEVQINPLWPVRGATRDEVLAYPEGAPVGSARTGLIAAAPVADAPVADVPAAQMPDAPVADVPAAQMPNAPLAELPEAPVAAAPVAEAPVPAAPAVEPYAADAPPAEVAQYTLRSGDNLTNLADAYGTTIDAILAANGISNANRIYVGQTLTIPAASPAIAADIPVADAPVADARVADAPVADAPVAEAPAEGDTTYTVQRGDSAILIARHFSVDESALLQANGISNANRIYVGQTLTIPAASPAIAQDAPVADAPVADAPLANAPAEGDTTYTVQRGDSAILIARHFGVDESALLQANDIVNPNRIYVGETLTIPGAAS